MGWVIDDKQLVAFSEQRKESLGIRGIRPMPGWIEVCHSAISSNASEIRHRVMEQDGGRCAVDEPVKRELARPFGLCTPSPSGGWHWPYLLAVSDHPSAIARVFGDAPRLALYGEGSQGEVR